MPVAHVLSDEMQRLLEEVRHAQATVKVHVHGIHIFVVQLTCIGKEGSMV
jgi:hypothetical protein